MDEKDLIVIVKNRGLPRPTRLNALAEILRHPAPGMLKRLLDDDKILVTLTLDIHQKGAASSCFWLLYEAFGLNDEPDTNLTGE